MARLAAAVKTTMNNSNATMTAQFNQLTQTLNTMVAGSNSSVNNQQQAMQAQMETLTKKLDSLFSPQANQDTVAVYPEPGKEEQIMKLIQELTNEMKSLDRRVDARINGLVQHQRGLRVNQRSRDSRPICFGCRATGHLQLSCPQRGLYERRNVPRNSLPAPENMGNRYQPGFSSRHRALGLPLTNGIVIIMIVNQKKSGMTNMHYGKQAAKNSLTTKGQPTTYRF